MRPKFSLFAGFLLLAATLLVSGCGTSKRVCLMNPKGGEVEWDRGAAFVHDSLYGVNCYVSFERHENGYLCFDLEVINSSNMPFVLDPSMIFIKPISFDGELIEGKGMLSAKDPEMAIMEMQENIRQANRRSRTAPIIGAVGWILGTTAALVTLGDSNYDNDYLADLYQGLGETALVASAVVSEDAAQDAITFEDMRYELETVSLRKTTLDPGYSIRGKIFFPEVFQAQEVDLVVTVDGEQMIFPFSVRYLKE